MKRAGSLLLLLLIINIASQAQPNVHPSSAKYEWPTDPLVKDKLEKWRDQKFGIIIHWGLYAVPGIIESWSLCSEDWITRDSNSNYENYKQWYWGLKDQFNPVKFNPQQWATAAHSAGMKYLVFTTKHHDGFAMFDTRESDFSIAKGPFATNEKANAAKYVFDAFRKEGFMTGAYFSKPDWHSKDYWWPLYATADRNNNYDIRKFPWKWQRYKDFTYNQIKELMTEYGSMDILWLDGGWVRPLETVNDEVRSWGAAIPAWSQDIDMNRIATMSREAQPGLLIVDRTVHGPYENYQTPEQRVPEKQLQYPWESCITLGDAWGFVPNDRYKAPGTVVKQLIDVVAKGGSLLLGIGPDASGLFPDTVVSRLAAIGKWMERNGEAIYNTRTLADYKEGNVYFTKAKEGKTVFALACMDDNGSVPSTIQWKVNAPSKAARMVLLQTGTPVKWTRTGDQVTVSLTAKQKQQCAGTSALAFRYVVD